MTDRTNIWFAGKFNKLRASRGGKCTWPGCDVTEDLEFAHVQETELKGRGRGRRERYYDIINNPDSYRLLCHIHHEELDYELDAIT